MNNPGFLVVAAKLILNVHDLNNEGSIGQTTDIRVIRMVDESGKEMGETPAVSGRMLKHWHLAYMLREELGKNNNGKLCKDCKVWEPERQPDDEVSGIQNCVICDVHGFLNAKKGAKKGEGKSLRRSSCVSFSWLLPVIGADSTSKQVIHSRVAAAAQDTPTAPDQEKETSQMIFYKSYASSIYGVVSSIDLDRIGKPLAGTVNSVNVNDRRKSAVRALCPIVMGAFGASQSHALPHGRCIGLLAALSSNSKPLPNLVSPIYPNGFKESVDLLESMGDDVQYWGYGEVSVDEDKKKSDLQIIFKEIEAVLGS